MKKSVKRFVSLAVVLVLIMTLLPVAFAAEESRGKEFVAGKDNFFYLDQAGAYDALSFDYKTAGAGELAVIIRGSTWSSFYGDFRLTESGEKVDYDGITTEVLADGYIHATFDLAALQRTGCVNNRDKAPADIALIDIYNWTTVGGYIDNIQATKNEVIRGESFSAGVGKFFTFENAAYETISFEYKLMGQGDMAVILRDAENWPSKTYGDYRFTTTGLKYDYPAYCAGITCEPLDDGYILVTMDLAQLGRSGLADNRNTAPVNVGVLDIYSWTDVDGYIDNIQYLGHVHNFENGICAGCGELESAFLVLTKDEQVNLSLTEDLYVDLNGFTLTGTIATNGFKVYGIDSTTDEYVCNSMGYFNCVDAQGNVVVPVSNHKTDVSGAVRRYLTISTEAGYTFHRFYLGITKQTLRPAVTGVGYKAVFYGDEMVKAAMDTKDAYGYTLYLEGKSEHIASMTSDSFTSGKELALRVQNFDVENHSETNLYASVWMNLNSERISSTECSMTLRNLVETINDKYADLTGSQLAAVKEMITTNAVMQTWDVENLLKEEAESRGQAFEAGKDNYFTFEAGTWDVLTFDYKTNGEGEVALIIRGSQWTKFYGDFRLTAAGEKVDYDGIATEMLDDGYIRVTVEPALLGRTNCANDRSNAPEDIALIDIYNWSTVGGYIDNIQVSNKEPESVVRGQAFEAGKDNYFTFEAGAWDVLTFDYKTNGEGEVALIIRGSQWTKFYGDFRLTAAGEKVDYDGIATEMLDDGYIRVTVEPALLGRTNCANDRSNAPEDIALIDIYNWSTVGGYIDNIQISNNEYEDVVRGQTFEAAKDNYFTFTAGAWNTLSFDYKTDGAGELAVILRGSNWTSFYGDFRLTEAGEKVDYAGITVVKLSDGYLRVTFDIAALQRSVCVNNRDGAPGDLALIDIYNWSTVGGYIDNIQFS